MNRRKLTASDKNKTERKIAGRIRAGRNEPDRIRADRSEPGRIRAGRNEPDQNRAGRGEPDQIRAGRNEPDQIKAGRGEPDQTWRGWKRRKRRDEYSPLQTKVFIWTVLLIFASIIGMWGLYTFVLHGHFANAVVGFLNTFIYHDYERALDVYRRVFRNNYFLFFMLGALLIFFVIMRVYLSNFTKYFNEINGAIDALMREDAGDVTLSVELAATEKKINQIIHTLEQRKLAAELAEQRKNDLVVYLAHDLKTPLTSVIGYLTLLHDEAQISEELREKYLSISLEKAERLEDLINEFFEITRFNLTNITLEYSRVNLTRLLEQLAYEFQPMFSEKNLTCSLKVAPDIMIKCDVDKMQRVFDNLLRNAVNYSYENEEIMIRVTQEERDVHIIFSNHGNTIPPDKLERIFEQFYRLDSARGSRSGGAGLGLAIAKKIVESHNGIIMVRSENEIIEFEVVI